MPASADQPLTGFAPAKVNLTLLVAGKRADGYHDIESLVVFAQERDILRLEPGPELALSANGPFAGESGPAGDNLVLNAARALRRQVPDLRTGAFLLTKNLPVAAGLGGGSADAAAALRLLAAANAMTPDDPRLFAAARETGSDVPVCLDPRPRLMRGKGDVLSGPLALPPLFAVLVNPGLPASTRDVFAAHAQTGTGPGRQQEAMPPSPDDTALMRYLHATPNDLEDAAIAVQPAIREVLSALKAQPGCRLARMSGSGSTCFGLFADAATSTAARELQRQHPHWWVRESILGAG